MGDESTLRPGLYRLPDDPVGPRVLIPGFRSAISVRGAFGWFTAGWISKLAPGLAEYLNRQNTTPIDFTVAPAIFPQEQTAIKQGYTMSAEEASRRIVDVFINGRIQATALARHALDCLAWMIATERLQLRIAVPKIGSNYHPKIWLFDDGAHQVLARGSGNATGHGVSSGVEHLDVDVTWVDYSRARVGEGVAILEDWARGNSPGIERIVELSEAFEQDIIYSAPESAPSRTDYERAMIDDMSPPWATDQSEKLRLRFLAPRSPNQPRLVIPSDLRWRDGPYAHQGQAVDAWESEPDPEHGTISMATGAGKTITALICATRVQDRTADKPLLIVISAPSIPLIMQWGEEVKKFGLDPIVPSLESNTEVALTNSFRGLSRGGTQVVIVTNNLLCSPAFQTTIARKISGIITLFIADEAHTLGAEGFLAHRPEFFERRLALSATPERQYDYDGTEAIFAFFGHPVYKFDLGRAIGFCLSPYDYYVHAATLDGDELDEFNNLTRRIGAALGQGIDEDDDSLTSLVMARRKIIETTRSKLSLLRTVLERRQPRLLTQTLIYASAKNPEQFEEIAAMLTDLNIRWAPVTQDTTAKRSLLTQTLATFEKGGYQVLLAKKVLDEGIDIPSIREAFIVASSTVQREWIQRRGRVLRKHPDKQWAILHDFLTLPPAQIFHYEETTSMKKIIGTELYRAYSFAAHARNSTDDNGVLADLHRIRSAYWPEGGNSPILQRAGDTLVSPATPQGSLW